MKRIEKRMACPPSPRKEIKMVSRRTGRPIPDPDTIDTESKVVDDMNTIDEDLDNGPPDGIQSGFSAFNPTALTGITMKETKMAKNKPTPKAKPAKSADEMPAMVAQETITHEDGTVEHINPVPAREPTLQELKAAAALEKIAAKKARLEAAAAKKAEREAAKAVKVTATVEERAAKKAEREARLAALVGDGKKYVGSMLALADRVKQGVYVKSATGQLRSTNELAEVLDAVPVDNVFRLAKIVLGLDENPYINLNTGQQSMNLRNRMRGALKKGTITMDFIKQTIAEEGLDTAHDWAAKKLEKQAARAARAAEAKAAKAAKATAKAEEPVTA